VLGVLSRAGLVQAAGRGVGQFESIIEFPVGEESGVIGDGGTVELQLDVMVEVNALRVVLAVTHKVLRSEWQGINGIAGVSRR
jgi:hypothetical protein